MNNQQVIDQIKEMVRVGSGARVLGEVMRKYDGAYYYGVFVGQAKETVSGIPLVLGTYDTTNWGTLQTYAPSSATIGSLVAHKDKWLTVIANTGTMGDAWVPSNYWFVAVEISAPPPEKAYDDDSINAMSEFIEEVGNRTVRCAQVVADMYSDAKREYLLPENYSPEAYASFLNSLDFEYDSGYGGQYLAGLIWYTDGSWSERYEYDGSECWDYKCYPPIPPELKR